MKNIYFVSKVLLGLVVLTAVMFAVGRSDPMVDPSAHSYGPSGTRVFAQILRESGYDVDVVNDAKPRVSPSSLIVAFPVRGDNNRDESGLKAHLKAGGKLFYAPITQDFDGNSRRATERSTEIEIDGETKLELSLSELGTYTDWGKESSKKPVYMSGASTVAVVGQVPEGGEFLEFSDALPITNRFVDKVSNLPVFLGALKSFYPQGKIVIYDSLSGRSFSKGILATVGLWVQYSWYQILILFVVFSVMMGRRFGLPIFDRKVQVGQRELVDAIGTFWRLNKATEMAVSSYLRNADRLLRSSLKVPLDAPVEARNELLPDNLKELLRQAEAFTLTRYPSSVVVPAIKKLDKEIHNFIGDRSPGRTSNWRFR